MTETLADPERELAISYAQSAVRPHLRALWMVDERFGTIVAETTDPTIGEMRLLWWREALAGTQDEVRSEPLLERVAETLGSKPGDGAEWGAMAEGWHALLQEPLTKPELERFARERGGRLFSLSASLLTDELPAYVTEAGKGWALADLSCRVRDPAVAAEARMLAQAVLDGVKRQTWPVALRSLGALAVLARRDARSGGRRQGSPSRVARMAWHSLSGR